VSALTLAERYALRFARWARDRRKGARVFRCACCGRSDVDLLEVAGRLVCDGCRSTESPAGLRLLGGQGGADGREER